MNQPANRPDVDVVIAGAGFAGLYLVHRLRGLGFSLRVFEGADDIGGTWYWNRYPGARCDIQSVDYSFSFDPALESEWQWSEKYATQPEILAYLDFVARRYDLRRDITFSTRVDAAAWDDDAKLWRITTSDGATTTCRHYVMATGCLSQPKQLDIEGVERFRGEVYYTSSWPHEGVDFSGKRVAVIGTGSSGIQSIPIIARQCAALTVFQRTPNFSMPAGNGPIPEEKLEAIRGREAEFREAARRSQAGVTMPIPERSVFDVSDEERQAVFEAAWAKGELLAPAATFTDLAVDPAANDLWCEFVRNKIRAIVDDPETAETLCPDDHPFGTKRPCLDTDYYATFNLPHVRLVNLRKTPLQTITETGIDTTAESFEFDAVVLATGFDAMTGALTAVDITGRDGVTLAEKWQHGPTTYLGLTTAGFPNLFMITGPGSPSVLSNMMVSIEQHVDWVSDAIAHMRDEGFDTIEPTQTAEDGWVEHVNDCGDITLFPRADSWYMGANVPGKPRVFLPYVGGVDRYREACDEVVERGYLGFELRGPDKRQCHDGVIRTLQPDVVMLLEATAALGLPPLESLAPDQAREFMAAGNAQRPPGPDVGEIVDGTLPGPEGDLAYRLYRPPTPGPHPLVVYFHGGGWVLGSHDSDDPFCRDLCLQSDCVLVSVDYRHAPEAPFPAAVEDGYAAARYIAGNPAEFGGTSGPITVCGWSAGGNIAAVVCQLAQAAGGPSIAGQVLVNPVTDCDFTRDSYAANGDGYVLTAELMRWFWNHYAPPEQRHDPKASPLRAEDLSGLPPALIATCEFDPLRDEGVAYAEALSAAGVEVTHLPCRGQIHTSLTSVGMILSGAEARAEIARALGEFARAARSEGTEAQRVPASG
jgi:cation diffusion facilitator CzcD-associated flavoprotein CzcO/acetyl esterase/lipase